MRDDDAVRTNEVQGSMGRGNFDTNLTSSMEVRLRWEIDYIHRACRLVPSTALLGLCIAQLGLDKDAMLLLTRAGFRVDMRNAGSEVDALRSDDIISNPDVFFGP